MKIYKILIVSLALALFAGCGKKKTAVNGGTAAHTSAPAPTVTPEEEIAKAKADAARIEADKKKEGRGSVNSKRHGTNTGGSASQAQQGSSSADASGSGGGSKSTVPKSTPSHLALNLALTGGSSADGHVFTGSAADGIISELKLKAELKSVADQKRNLVLATSIVDMAYLVDNQGVLTIDIAFKKGNGISKQSAKTEFSATGRMRATSNVGKASEIEITAECLDIHATNDKCSNLLVSFEQGGAEATALLRQTYANIRAEYDKVTEANEYATLVEFFKNASLDVETGNKVQTAYLHTYEVVKGKAGFKAVIVGKKGQIIAFRDDLVLKKSFAEPSIAVDKETQFKDVDLWMGRVIGKDLGFLNSISSARLVKNNTKGEISIDVVVSSASTGSSDTMTLKFSRIAVAAHL